MGQVPARPPMLWRVDVTGGLCGGLPRKSSAGPPIPFGGRPVGAILLLKRLRYAGDTGRQRAIERGFTLIEVLVVVAILALLVAILLPSLVRARASSRQVQCAAYIRQQAAVCMMYANDALGKMPPNPTQLKPPGSNPMWYIDVVIQLSDIRYDARKLFRKYIKGEMNIYVCPANGGPPIDSQEVAAYLQGSPYMLGQYMNFYNSTCVFDGSSYTNPWAPRAEWGEGGPASSVPIIQDMLQGSNVSGSLNDPGAAFSFNHGPGMPRSRLGKYSPIGNWRQSVDRRMAEGANVAYLDGHATWVKNLRLGGGNRWALDLNWSRSGMRMLQASEPNGWSTCGAPLTVAGRILRK